MRTFCKPTFFPPIAAWLALFSVIMLFVAPVISKSLMQNTACSHHQPFVAMHNMSMHHDMAQGEHENCHELKTIHTILMSNIGQSPMEDIACGYCQLLICLPFILFFLAIFLWLLIICTRVECFDNYHYPVISRRPWSLQFARAPPERIPLS
ncbi:DUF2946 domain-containing protein [Moellerella wisconsensis]|uniref:DUF2946 domain-containing protein n=1 Tax=Moellerella wisconsensis TaxID=158849 RepID=UPI003075F592